MSEHFCGSCNRLRITADGNLKVNKKNVFQTYIIVSKEDEASKIMTCSHTFSFSRYARCMSFPGLSVGTFMR